MAAAIPTVPSFSATLGYFFNDISLSSPATAVALPRTSFLAKFFVPRSKPSLLSSSFPLRHKLSVCCQQQQQQQLPAIPQEQRWMFEESEINGPDIWNKTWYPKAADHITTKKTWYIVDATDKILGRMASAIAVHIRGKNLATYTPSVDMGAYVIVALEVQMTEEMAACLDLMLLSKIMNFGKKALEVQMTEEMAACLDLMLLSKIMNFGKKAQPVEDYWSLHVDSRIIIFEKNKVTWSGETLISSSLSIEKC